MVTVVEPVFIGVAATGAVGTVVAAVNDTVLVDGVEAVGAVNSDGFRIVYTVTGVEGTGAVGAVIPEVIHEHDSLEAFARVGNVSLRIDSNIAVTGVAGTGAVGTVAIRVDDTILVSGVQGVAAVGDVEIEVDDGVSVTGVSGVGAVGTVKFGGWTQINDAQNPNWVAVNGAQVPNWIDVDVAA